MFEVRVVLLAICLNTGAAEPPLPPAVLALLPTPCTEFVPWPDGTVWVFRQDGATAVWDGQGWTTPEQPRLGSVALALETKPGEWALAVTGDKGQCSVVRVAGKAVGSTVPLTEKIYEPAMACGGDGTLWVLSATGSACSLAPDGKVGVHDLSPTHKKNMGSRAVPRPLAIDVPGHGLWVWWFGHGDWWDSDYTPELRVYENGAWRQVLLAAAQGNHASDKFGGVVLTRDGDLLCGKAKGLFSLVSPATGAEKPLPLTAPQDETCTFLAALRNGDSLAMVGPRSSFRQHEPAHGGWCGTLLRIDGKTGTGQVLLSGVDFGDTSYQGDRPWVETEAGVLLAAVNAGLLFLPADGGPPQRLDWRNGLPFANIHRMRAVGDRLYLLSQDQGFAICSLRSLLAAKPSAEADRWQMETVVRPPVLGPDGAIWYVTAAGAGELVRRKGDAVQRWPITGPNFSARHLWYMALDSKGRPWLLMPPAMRYGNLILDNGTWRAFPKVEDAYVTIAQEEKGNPGFSAGVPTDPLFPAFAGDGRVAYRDRDDEIRFFEGAKWETGKRDDGTALGSGGFAGLPFYEAGVLTVFYTRKDCFLQFRNGSWQPAEGKLVDPHPGVTRDPTRRKKPQLPHWPGAGASGNARSFSDNAGTLWAGTPQELYRGLGDVWVRWPTLGTPLCMATGISSVQVDGDGDLWFILAGSEYINLGVDAEGNRTSMGTGGDYPRLVHYRMQGTPPTLAWRSPPPATSSVADVRCVAALGAPGSASTFAYRLDDAEWKAAAGAGPAECTIALTGIANGKHTCAVRAFDGFFRSSNVLTAEFAVQRDRTTEIRDTIKLLSSVDFAAREKASHTLAALGPEILPALTEARKAADKDLAWWLDATIQEINDRAKAPGAAAKEGSQAP